MIKRKLSGVWIASTSWAISGQLTSLPGISSVGTILAFTDRLQSVDLLDEYVWHLFTKISQEGAGPLPPPDPYEPPNPCPQCWTLSPSNMSLVLNPTLQRTAFSVYAAVYSAATALHNLLRCDERGCNRAADRNIYPWEVGGHSMSPYGSLRKMQKVVIRCKKKHQVARNCQIRILKS